eukprot:COSAG01_NODE_4170_length_5272_cov_1.762126_2_plen_53_part_00
MEQVQILEDRLEAADETERLLKAEKAKGGQQQNTIQVRRLHQPNGGQLRHAI